MSDPERIWLQNAADARATGERLWCQDKVWPECAEQQEPTEYIRADLYASRISQQDAELERLRRELADVRDNLAEAEKDTHYWRVEYDKARKAAFIEAAEIATATATDVRNGDRARFTASHIAMALKKKAEETRT